MKCLKCGGDEFSVQVVACAIYKAGEFQAFEYDEEILPVPTANAVCKGLRHRASGVLVHHRRQTGAEADGEENLMPDPQKLSVSSSQASALFDVNPYYTSFILWQHFRRGLALDPSWNERIEWGTLLQDDILAATAKVYRLEATENTANEYVRAGPAGAPIARLIYAADSGP